MSITRLGEPLLLTDQVFSAIHEAIMSGDIPAGARLRIRDLAAQLGTSPMPVREAIGRLEQAGLAQRVPHKGAVVIDLSPAELVHVYDTRLLLEMEASPFRRCGDHPVRLRADARGVRPDDGGRFASVPSRHWIMTKLY